MIHNVIDRHNRRTAKLNLKHDFFRQFPELREKFDAVLYEVDKSDGHTLYNYTVDALLEWEKKRPLHDYDCAEIVEIEFMNTKDNYPEWYPDEFIGSQGGHAKLFANFASRSQALKNGFAWFQQNTDRYATRELMRAFVECWVRAVCWDEDKVDMGKYFSLSTGLFASSYFEDDVMEYCEEKAKEDEPDWDDDPYLAPDGRRWASLVQRVANRSIVASRPYMESMGLTKAKAMSGEAAMLYSIDAKSNKSKYYEMLILEDRGGYTLHKRWGRLGDTFRTDSKDYPDLGSAMAALEKVKRSKMKGSSKYRDAFDSRTHKTPDGKQLPKGQYPIGLSSNAGPWQNQSIQTCKPALRQLITVIEEAIADAANEDMSGVLTDLQLANGYVSELGTSSMAKEIRKKIKAPLSRLTGMGRHQFNPAKTVKELKTLSRYLSKQMSMCMTASVVDRTASTKTSGMSWHQFIPYLDVQRGLEHHDHFLTEVVAEAMETFDWRENPKGLGDIDSKLLYWIDEALSDRSDERDAFSTVKIDIEEEAEYYYEAFAKAKGWKRASTKTATSDEWANAFLRWLEKSHDEHIGPFEVYSWGEYLISDLWQAVSGNAGHPREGKADTQKAIAKFMGKWMKSVDDWYKWEERNSHLLKEGSEKTAIRFPLDGVRKHELMPSSIANKIPKLYEQDGVEDPMCYVKFFNPYGRGVWYITEFDGRETMFGYAKITHGELGYISLSELANANRNGLPLIERDRSWKPRPLSQAKGT